MVILNIISDYKLLKTIIIETNNLPQRRGRHREIIEYI